jgi:hypothetical protein
MCGGFLKDLKLVPVKLGLFVCFPKILKSHGNYFCEMFQCCPSRTFVICETVVCTFFNVLLTCVHFELYLRNSQHTALIRYLIFVILPYMFRGFIQPIIKRLCVQCCKW